MKGLLIKDLKILGTQKQTLIIMAALVAFFVFTSMDSGFVAAYLTGVTMVTGLGTLSYDSADNGYLFLFTLPITRKQYVLEKYTFIGLLLSVVGVMGIMIVGVTNIIHHQGNLLEAVLGAVSTMLVIAVIAWVMIPVQLKYGAERLRTVMGIMAGCIFAGAFIGAKVIEMMDIDVEAILASLPENTPLVVAGALVVLIGIVTVISIKISISIMEHKEF